ncbi:MAG: U32 family peptidase [bacterium]|nr:U32 family peptidase [bacterium]
MNWIVVPNSKKQFDILLKKDIEGLVIGINDLSINTNFSIDIKEIDEYVKLIKDNNKKVYIYLNMMYHNNKLDMLEKIMNNNSIDYIFFYDLAVLNIAKKLGITNKLIIAQNHMNVSIYSNNYYYDKGIKQSLLSSELQLKEILEISALSEINIMVYAYGKREIFNSKRKLLFSYFKHFQLPSKKNKYLIKNTDNYYLIKEDKNGTIIMDCHILDLQEELSILNNNGIKNILLDSTDIDEDKFLNTLDDYIDNKLRDKLRYKGFLYQSVKVKVMP